MKIAMMIVLILTMLSSGCVAPEGIRSQRGDPAKTVRLKFEAFNRHDAGAIELRYAPNAVLHSPDYPELHGNTAIAQTYRQLFAAIPDAVDTVQALGYFEDKVYAQFVLSGHFNGVMDKPITARIISVYTIKDDLIVDDATYYDRKAP